MLLLAAAPNEHKAQTMRSARERARAVPEVDRFLMATTMTE